MNEQDERKQTQEELMRNAFDTTYYEVLAFRKSRDDYSPYSYVEDGDEPVLFDEETLEEWDWE